MEALSSGKEILDTMLGHLGFVVTVESTDGEQGPCLQILTEESGALAGPGGERLDEIQYLVNRLLWEQRGREAPRIRVDVEHFQKTSASSVPVPRMEEIRRPIVGFFGLISEWVDLNLIEALRKRHPDVSFVLRGKSEV